MNVECYWAVKASNTHTALAKLSHPLNAALLYLCIRKCRNCKRNVCQAAAVGKGERNFK